METNLNELGLLRESIKRFAEKHLNPFIDGWEKDYHFPDSVFEKLGAEGFLGTLIEEEYGGVGGDYLMAGTWCEEFGRVPSVGLTVAVNMHALVISPAIQRFGSKELKEKYLPGAVEGKLLGAYAFTEPGAGSDLSNAQTKAVEDGDHFILNGAKTFITNGARADFIIVLTRTDLSAGYKGYSSFVVDTKSEGFNVSKKLEKLGWHCSDTAELSFEDVRVPKSHLLGELGKGWHQAMASLEWERLMLALTSLGGANQCLEDTLVYTSDRKVFGKAVNEFDYNRYQLDKSVSELAAAKALCDYCLDLLSNGKRCRTEVSLCKYFTCQKAIEIADRCLQLHGGYGYTTEFKPERWLRDLRLNTIGGGTNEIMLRVAAKELFG